MTEKKVQRPSAPSAASSAIDSFLARAKQIDPSQSGGPQARLVFALDATMSRQPTWDLACRVQGEMFAATGFTGGLQVQLVYFRGFNECRSSRWVADPRALTDLMTTIECRGGQTQIERVLRHVRNEATRSPLKVLVYVGDAMEEPLDDLCKIVGELGLLGVKAFMFQEGHDRDASVAFHELARLTGGAYARFDLNAPNALTGLLRAAATYAASGFEGLNRIASTNQEARGLLTAMTRQKP